MNKKENLVVESMNRGFTLVEMLVVIALIGMLATLVVKNVVPALQGSSETIADAGCGVIKDAVASYQLKHKKLPSSLDQLCGGEDPILSNDKDLYDPWDNKYELVLKDKTRVVIRSAGPDGKMGTDDDIRSDSKRL